MPDDARGEGPEHKHDAAAAIGTALIFGFLAYALFSVADASIKGIGSRLSVFEVSFLIALIGLFLLPFVKEKGDAWPRIFHMRRPVLVLFRSVAGTLAGIFAIVAFTAIPLAEAYALIFLAPILALVLSILFLREQVGWRRWSSVGVGLIGVLVVMRPGFRGIEVGHIAAFLSALCIGTSVVCLRVLGNTERRVAIFSVLNLVNLVAVLPLMLWHGILMPDLKEWALLLLCGVTAGAGQLLLMAATRRAPANRVAPAQYSQLVWAIIFGAVLFAEYPDLFTATGMLLIAASGLFLIQRRPRQAVAVPGPLP